MKRIVLLSLGLLALAGVVARAHASRHTLTVGGLQRSYVLFRPSGLGRKAPVPLVVVLHGGFGSGTQAQKSYGWDETAAAEGFVVVYPNGFRRSWNAGGTCCGPALRDAVDDVAFLDATIRAVAAEESIDPRRIYVTGISNGAAMAYRYACEGAVRVAAIGSVAGSMTAACPAPRPVSVVEIHGLADENIPFEGGLGSKGVSGVKWPSVEATLRTFRRADGCAEPVLRHMGAAMRSDAACAGGRSVALIAVTGAGHQWPGSVPPRPALRRLFGLDPPSRALDATAVLWEFFARHPLADG